MFEITTENKKYKFVNDGGVPKVYRYGELQEQGSKAWLTLLQKVEKYEEALVEIAYSDESCSLEYSDMCESVARKALKE